MDMSNSEQRVNHEYFPTFVMTVADVLALDVLEPHESLLDKGLVAYAPEGAPILFVSHQWVSFDHPDPQSVQLRALQCVLTAVLDGDIMSKFELEEWEGFARGVDKRKTASAAHAASLAQMQHNLTQESFAEEIKRSVIWWDFFSIPQKREAGALEAGITGVDSGDSPQLRAIKSIPYYIERSSYFIVVAPATTHQDTGKPCNLESWRSRGWCRLEEMANFLSKQMMNPLIITEHKHVHVEEFADFWSFRANSPLGAVGCGDFTADSDRWVCMQVLHGMWKGKLVQLARANQRMMLTLFGVMQTKLMAMPADLASLSPEVFGDYTGTDAEWNNTASTWEAISTDWKLGDLSEEGHPIGPPIVVAMLGDANLMRSAFSAESGYDVLERHKATGATTLMHAAGAGSCEAVQVCFELAQQAAAAAAAAKGGAEEEELYETHATVQDGKTRVERKALNFVDVGTNKLNITPLDRAIRCGHVDCSKLLLELGASPLTRRSTGDTALHAAAEMGRFECAVALLDAGAEIDAVNEDGSSALHLSATSFTLFGSQEGKVRVAALLLERGASTQLRDARGKTASEVATNEGAAGMVAVFEAAGGGGGS